MPKLNLSIITPERQVLQQEVDFVAMPAYEGEIGVLPGHTACMLQLKTGILRYTSGKDKNAFAIMGGFAEILNNDVSVFAEDAALAEEIDLEDARQQVQKTKHAISAHHKDLDLAQADQTLKWETARIKLAMQKNKIPAQKQKPMQ